MSIDLSKADYDRLVNILSGYPDFSNPFTRYTFISNIFTSVPRGQDIVANLTISGNARIAAQSVIQRLTHFGQNEPGQEALSLLINSLINDVGDSDDTAFLRDLFQKYHLQGQPIAIRPLPETAWRGERNAGKIKEKMLGENTLRDIFELELALEASRAVVRISNGDRGTGFLAGEGLIMTNHHVIPDRATAANSRFAFYCQDNADMTARDRIVCGAKPDGLFYTDPTLDVTVVEIANPPQDIQPLRLLSVRARPDSRVAIIHHPLGETKKITLQNNFVMYADAQRVQYTTATQKGSSGSPVFDSQYEVIALHHSGDTVEVDTDSATSDQWRYVRNEGSGMRAILHQIEQDAPDVYARLNVRR
ncbi:MAG: trypsin-like peptidase domain-containing protein [Anaerolineales bacterium]|nr:trypsin-like peptidase domain-containing protein [Anaerolineales bacterium]